MPHGSVNSRKITPQPKVDKQNGIKDLPVPGNSNSSPSGFFFWNHLKIEVYSRKPNKVDQLKVYITGENKTYQK